MLKTAYKKKAMQKNTKTDSSVQCQWEKESGEKKETMSHNPTYYWVVMKFIRSRNAIKHSNINPVLLRSMKKCRPTCRRHFNKSVTCRTAVVYRHQRTAKEEGQKPLFSDPKRFTISLHFMSATYRDLVSVQATTNRITLSCKFNFIFF